MSDNDNATKISLSAFETIVAALHAAEPAGPMTTFTRDPLDPANDRANVTIICRKTGDADYTDVIRWIDAMIQQVPALVEIAKAAMGSRVTVDSEASAREQYLAMQRLDAALEKVTR